MLEYLLIFTLGATGYGAMESLFRGFTHWTMLIAGGVCLLAIYTINTRMKKGGFVLRAAIGAAIITCCELVVGILVNIVFKWNVWDYSANYLNFYGQICPLFSGIWFVICLPLDYICKGIKRNLFSSPWHLPGSAAFKQE